MSNLISKLLNNSLKYIVGIGVALLIITQWDAVLEILGSGSSSPQTSQTERTDTQQPNQSTATKPTPTETRVPSNKPTKEFDDRAAQKTRKKTPEEAAVLPDDKPAPPQTAKTRYSRVKSLKIASWNVANIGISKDDEEVEYIAQLLKGFDIVAIQEISTKLSGPRAIAKLNERLNNTGARWDYIISDPTSGAGSERYAYMWKKSATDLASKTWLVGAQAIDDSLDREPYMARFYFGEDRLLISNFHAVPTTKKPQKEIVYLDNIHRLYRKDDMVFLGDFNLSQKHKAFDELKDSGYEAALENQKTSLRRIKTSSGYLAQEYDNIFVEKSPLRIKRSGIVDFVPDFESLKEARQISDHLPVWAEIERTE